MSGWYDSLFPPLKICPKATLYRHDRNRDWQRQHDRLNTRPLDRLSTRCIVGQSGGDRPEINSFARGGRSSNNTLKEDADGEYSFDDVFEDVLGDDSAL